VQVRAQSNRSRWGSTEGSGVIVRPEGIVVTNYHVVKDGTRFSIVLPQGNRLPASLLGTDPDTDLAVLRIDSDDPKRSFPFLELDPRTPKVGATVLVLGNPFGLGTSVTRGIISGLGRSDLDMNTYEDFLQTDAAINPGNSGGPLIGLEGKVLGISTAQGLESNDDLGICFAIPSSLVSQVVEGILEDGEVIRGWLGVQVQSFRPDRVRGYDGVSKVRISKLTDLSPARTAGLRQGDIILAVGKRRLITPKDLMTSVAVLDPGDTVQMTIWRNGEELKLRVVLARRPSPDRD
jgi:S1-C subfamily serine protease